RAAGGDYARGHRRALDGGGGGRDGDPERHRPIATSSRSALTRIAARRPDEGAGAVIARYHHDPERSAATYVSGDMRLGERPRFEAHLLGCEGCWREVSLGWRGRGLVEAAREVAPPGLRG